MLLFLFGDTEKKICTTRTAMTATVPTYSDQMMLFLYIYRISFFTSVELVEVVLNSRFCIRLLSAEFLDTKLASEGTDNWNVFILQLLHGPKSMRLALAELSADQASQYDSRRQLIKVQTPTSMFVIACWYNIEKMAVHKTLRYYNSTSKLAIFS